MQLLELMTQVQELCVLLVPITGKGKIQTPEVAENSPLDSLVEDFIPASFFKSAQRYLESRHGNCHRAAGFCWQRPVSGSYVRIKPLHLLLKFITFYLQD